MDIPNSPLLTQVFDSSDDFVPASGSAYLAFNGIEERSSHFDKTALADAGISLLEITREGDSDFDIGSNAEKETYRLRSRSQLSSLWSGGSWSTIYIDITGLRHHIWIPLLRSAIETGRDVRVIYVEPRHYKPNATPTEGQIFDLSERITGISPIPGFASLSRTDDFIFVPLLGFEGTRVAFLLEDVQPVDDRILPVVGVPGFRPEHPFNTYLANRVALRETGAWQNVLYADANCPFSLFYLLEDIATKHNKTAIKIAVVGTKPHALGASLFVMKNRGFAELIYDHPIRKSERTMGIGRLLEYDVGAFCK